MVANPNYRLFDIKEHERKKLRAYCKKHGLLITRFPIMVAMDFIDKNPDYLEAKES